MPLALAVPGLLDVAAEALAACEALRRVAGRTHGRNVDDADTEMLRALGVDAPTAPLAALGAGLDAGTDWIARADPVTAFVTHEDVRILGRVDDLADAEASTLLALLQRHFADDGLAFAAPRADAWFVRTATAQQVDLVPLVTAVDRPLRSRLPTGRDAGRWRRWWTEAQMLLHEHPLAAREHAPVNALWFAGGGTLASPALPGLRGFASAGRDGDMLRGLARRSGADARPLAAWMEGLDGKAPCAIVAERIVDAGSLAAIADDLLPALVDALDRGRLDTLTLIGSGRAQVVRWDVPRAGLLGRLLRKSADFRVPARDDA
jgi:hypothetical protein